MEPNPRQARRRKKATRDVPKESEWSDWQWSQEHNSFWRVNLADQTKYEYRQHNEATSAAADSATTGIEPRYTYEYPDNSRRFSGSSIASNVPMTVKDGLYDTSTQSGSQSYLLGNQNARIACLNGSLYAEIPQTDPRTSYVDSADRLIPVSAEPTPSAGQEAPESCTIRATPRMTELRHSSFSVRGTSFFEIGRVFGVAWSTYSSERSSFEDSFFDEEPLICNDHEDYKILQFVVVELRNNEDHCVCLPVASDHRGYEREGVRLQELGFICKSESKLATVEGINLPHVSISSTEGFSNPSLINYSRIYIIECAVEVKCIGFLPPKSIKCLRQNILRVNPQAQQTAGTLYFRPTRTEDLSGEEISRRRSEAERADRNASDRRKRRKSDLKNDRNRSRRQNATGAEWSSHYVTGVSNFLSNIPVQASTSSNPNYTYSNAPHLTAVPVNRTSGSQSLYGTVYQGAEANDMEQNGTANTPKEVEVVEAAEATDSARLVASLKIADQEGGVHDGKQKSIHRTFQVTPVSLAAPQVTRQNASWETPSTMSSK